MQHEINKILKNLLHIVVHPDHFTFGVYSVPNQQEWFTKLATLITNHVPSRCRSFSN